MSTHRLRTTATVSVLESHSLVKKAGAHRVQVSVWTVEQQALSRMCVLGGDLYVREERMTLGC